MTKGPESTLIGPDDQTSTAPDWPQFKDEILCPLCQYNLRGLTQPRCPECGFTFEWRELLDRRTHHPYLFEHQTHRNIWSFWKTFWRDCRPRRFWSEVTPSYPVNVRRLILYWIIANSVLPALFAVPIIRNIGTLLVLYARSVPAGTPLPPMFSFFSMGWYFLRWSPHAISGIVVFAAWPWFTVLALLIFRVSMRRAKIKTAHVVRCAIYSCDFPLLALITMGAFDFLSIRVTSSSLPALVLCPAITLYRLSIAYQKYLRFDHPFLTVLASQILVGLLLLDVLINLT